MAKGLSSIKSGDSTGLKKRRKVRIAKVQKAILYSLAVAGGIAAALVAPNALQVLEQFGWIKTRRNPYYTVNESVRKLQEGGFVKKDDRGFLYLTTKGERRLSEFGVTGFHLKKPRRWDGKWRVVSFDIKESRKVIRQQLRTTLTEIGFVCLHKSLWVYPYDCQDLITLLKADYEIGKDILYLVSEYIENDKMLRRHFELE